MPPPTALRPRAWPWWTGPQWFVESAYASVRRCCPKAVTRWCVTWWGDRTRWVPEVIRARPHLWTAGVPRGPGRHLWTAGVSGGPRLPGCRGLRFWSRGLVHAGRPRHRSLKSFPCLLVVGISGLLELHGGGAEGGECCLVALVMVRIGHLLLIGGLVEEAAAVVCGGPIVNMDVQEVELDAFVDHILER